MADEAAPRAVAVKLTNSGRAGRTFHDADRQAHYLAPGATYEGKVFEADRESLADLESADDADGTGGSTIDKSVTDLPPLDGLNRDQLLAVATSEGYLTLGNDASEDELREAIEHARAASGADELGDAVEALKRENTRNELIELAASESVEVESDDNKDQLALKIAQARAANA